MCCGECLCCFRTMSPLSIAITALVLNIIAFVFVIWQAADYVWIKKYQKALFWIGFVLALLGLLGVITLLILVLVRNSNKSPELNRIGRIISQVALIISPLAFMFLLGSSIGTIVDYIKLEDEFKGISVIPGKWWATAIVPTIMYIIFTSILTKCLRALDIIFNEDIYDSIQDKRIRDKCIIQNNTNQANAVINQTVPGTNQMVVNTTNPSAYNPNLTSANPVDNLNNPNYAMNNMNNMNPAYPKIN